MLEHVVRFVIALFVPALEESNVTGVLRDLAGSGVRRKTTQLLNQSGNSLAFVHGKLNLVSTEMTGNRARRILQRRARVLGAANDG